ncbi:MAG: hypothetical protein WBA67_02615 [Jannaschia sp.]
MPTVNMPQVDGGPIAPEMFGGNFLADRYTLGGAKGIEGLIEDLGVNGLRYPGGSLTERLFDIRTPDSPTAINDDGSIRDFVPLSDFMAYAEAHDHPVTIVIPTRDNLSRMTDGNGDRFPAFNEAELRDFVRDLATGEYGDAKISALEIGNEYWGSGEMTAVEYGRLSSRIADVIGDELDQVAAQTGRDPGIDILVQSGQNSGYSNLSEEFSGQSTEDVLDTLNDRYGTDFGREVVFGGGRINWRAVNDELVIREFSPDEAEAVDGVVTHLYSKESVSPGQRDFGLTQIGRSWEQEFPGIDIHVTEWNQSAADTRLEDDEDFGLAHAHEVLNVFESMVEAGVDEAHVWPLLQNTRNALSPDSLDGGLSPAGELFSMMSRALPGKQMLDFKVSDDAITEFQGVHADLHGFYGDGELVFYLASTAQTTETLSFDLSEMVAEGGAVTATIIGVPRGAKPNGIRTEAELERVPEEEVWDDGRIITTLDPGEILELRVTEFRPTAEFGAVMGRIDGLDEGPMVPDPLPDSPAIDDDFDLPKIPLPVEDDPDGDSDDVGSDDDDGGGIMDGLGWLLGILPLLALAGLAG